MVKELQKQVAELTTEVSPVDSLLDWPLCLGVQDSSQ